MRDSQQAILERMIELADSRIAAEHNRIERLREEIANKQSAIIHAQAAIAEYQKNKDDAQNSLERLAR